MKNILELVKLAPSPHNTQPIQWKITENKIEMYVVYDRILHVSDKELRDLHLSAGAAFEILQMAGIQVQNLKFHPVGQKDFLYASMEYTKGPEKGAHALKSRACYRGKFEAPKSPLQVSQPNVKIIQGKNKEIAALYDEASAFFLSRPEYAQELWSWLRLDPKNPRFFKDGLNAQMLRLDPILTVLSRFIMRPKVLAFLGKLKLIKPMVSEAPQNLSSEGFAVILRDPTKTLFEQGQELMQAWLSLEAQGRHLCPVTALIDDPKFEKEVREIAGLDRPIIHIVRFGVKPEKEKLSTSPRLSAEEITKA